MSRVNWGRPAIGAAALMLVAGLAGCASPSEEAGHHEGDGHHGSSDATLPYTGQEDVLLTIVAGDPGEFRFSPESVAVAAGQSVGITFRNDGAVPHELSFKNSGFHLHLGPGEQAAGSFIADETGEITFGCYIPGHFEAGMKGTLTVS